MTRFWIHLGQQPPRLLVEPAALTLGRSEDNDLVVEDASVSRRHLWILVRDGRVVLQDLGSLNGTHINGQWIQSAVEVEPGDDIRVGDVPLHLEAVTTAVMEAERLDRGVVDSLSRRYQTRQMAIPAVEAPADDPWTPATEALLCDLLAAASPEGAMAAALERLWAKLEPTRAVVFLLDPQGRLEVLAGRTGTGPDPRIKVSRAMLQTALDAGEAMLVTRPAADDRVPASISMMLSGLTTLITVPLMHAGDLVGLMYLDRAAGREPFGDAELAAAARWAPLLAARLHHHRSKQGLRDLQTRAREAALGQTLQQRLLPRPGAGADPRLKVAFRLRSSEEVGGDFLDLHVREHRLYACMGDVSGRGLPAVTDTATVRALLRAAAARSDSPAEILAHANARLMEELESELLVRVLVLDLDLRSGQLSVSSAAQERPFIMGVGRSPASWDVRQGPMLGASARADFPLQFATLNPGDTLVLASDGYFQATNTAGEVFGRPRLRSVLQAHLDAEPTLLLQRLLDAAQHHLGDQTPEDDQTLMAVRYLG